MSSQLDRTRRFTYARIPRIRIYNYERMQQARARALKIYDALFITLLFLITVLIVVIILTAR